MPYIKSELLDLAYQLTALDWVFSPKGDDATAAAERANRSVGSAMIESTTSFTLGDVLNMRYSMELGLSEREAINFHLDGHRHRFEELRELYTKMVNDYGDQMRDPSWSFEFGQRLLNLDIGLAMLEGEFGPIRVTPDSTYQHIVSSSCIIEARGLAKYSSTTRAPDDSSLKAEEMPPQFDVDDLPF